MTQKAKWETGKVTRADDLIAHLLVMLLVLALGTFPVSSAIHGSFAAAFREWRGYYLGAWPGGLSLFGGAALGSLLLCFVVEPFLNRLFGK